MQSLQSVVVMRHGCSLAPQLAAATHPLTRNHTHQLLNGNAQAADQIVVMRDGSVVEVGSHAELSGRAGSAYNELMRAQELILASV